MMSKFKEEIYHSCECHRLFPDQKGCRKGTKGTTYLQRSKNKLENVAMVLIDYKIVYVIVP